MDELTIEDFSTNELIDEIEQRDVNDKIKVIKSILGLKVWHNLNDVIEELKNI